MSTNINQYSARYLSTMLGDDFSKKSIRVAEVMDTRDPDKNGNLKVWLIGSSSDRNNPDSWLIAKYAPFFYGTTPDSTSPDFAGTKKSYGFWAVPPHRGNHVLVTLADNGITNYELFWFACVPEWNMNQMLPGISYGDVDGKASPVAEYNRVITSDDTKRPEHILYKQGLNNQRLGKDLVRGPNSSSARREAPSRVHGFLSPLGGRIVVDDGWTKEEVEVPDWNKQKIPPPEQDLSLERTDECIRIHTRSGAGIVISESEGLIFLINRDGTAWVEMTETGNIDMWSAVNVSIRSEADVNISAGNNLNLEAGKNVHVKSVSGDTKLYAFNNIDITAGQDYKVFVNNDGNLYVGNDMAVNVSNLYSLKANEIVNAAVDKMNVRAGGVYSLAGQQIRMNDPCGSQTPSKEAKQAETPKVERHPKNQFIAKSIASRVPESADWPQHFIQVPTVYNGVVRQLEGTNTSSGIGNGAGPNGKDSVKPSNGIEPPTDDTGLNEDAMNSDAVDEGVVDSTARDISGMSVSQRGIQFIMAFEKWRPYTYADPSSTNRSAKAIGYGFNTTSGKINPESPDYRFGMTEPDAFDTMTKLVNSNYGSYVKSVCKGAKVTQYQFDALVSVAYNGYSILQSSGVADLVKKNKHVEASKAIGNISVNRDRMVRTAVLYRTGDYGSGFNRDQAVKEGVANCFSVYKSVPENQKRQIQGALYKMGYRGTKLPGGNDYLNEIPGAGGFAGQDIQLSPNFKLSDLTKTSHSVSNTPMDEAVISNLKRLCSSVLEPVTSAFGRKPTINSGYRSTELNRVVGGSEQSQHSKGQAVDIELAGVSNLTLAKWISKNIGFDQLILENFNGEPSSGWVHVSVGGGRRQTLVYSGGRYSPYNFG